MMLFIYAVAMAALVGLFVADRKYGWACFFYTLAVLTMIGGSSHP